MKSIIPRATSFRPAVSPDVLLAGVAIVVAIAGSFAVAWVMARSSAPLFGAGLLGAAVATIFFARPDIGLLIVLFVRSSTDLAFQYFPISEGVKLVLLSPNTSLMLIVILAGGVYIVSRHVRVLSLPGGTLLALLLVTGVVGMLRSENVLYSLRQWLPLVSLFVVYALSAHFFRTPQRIQRVIDVIAASFILPAIYGFYQLAGHNGFILMGLSRIPGTFFHPNPFAFYLAMIITLFTCQSLVASGTRRWVSVAIVAAALPLLVGTLTRIAWGGTLAALLTVGAFRSRKLLVLVPLAVVLVAIAFPHTVERMGNPASDPTGTGLENRFEIWESTFTYWMDETRARDTSVVTMLNRLGGLGPGAVEFLTASREGEAYAAHNDYIRVLNEYGVLGLTLYALLLIVMLVFGYRAVRSSAGTPTASVPLSFFALTLAYMIMSITDNVFAATQNQVYYWTLAGMTVAISQTSSAPASRKAADRPRPVARGAPRAVPKAVGA